MKSPNISIIRAALLASIATSGLAFVTPAMGQDSTVVDEGEGGDEIIVTARRREENLLEEVQQHREALLHLGHIPIVERVDVEALLQHAVERGGFGLQGVGRGTRTVGEKTDRGARQDRMRHRIADKAHPPQHQEYADRCCPQRKGQATGQGPAHEAKFDEWLNQWQTGQRVNQVHECECSTGLPDWLE